MLSLSSGRIDRNFIMMNKSMVFTTFVYFMMSNLSVSKCDLSKIPGHLNKLGSHREPQGITWAGRFTDPVVFYKNFVEPGKPVIMKGVLQQVEHPGLFKWTDNILSQKYGKEIVKVEQSKIENRDTHSKLMPLKDFLNIYQLKDVYMVQSLNNKMKDLVLIPSTLQCGGFQKLIQDAVLWMGSHHTSSVLHYDPLDNLLCVLDGRKDVVLIDKAYKDMVEKDGFDQTGHFSRVDPQRVDFEMFPNLAQVIWHEAKLRQGDCLYIPQGWYHQVTSSGYRHVSVNIWFSHLWWFNSTDCPNDFSLYKPLEPVSTFGFASPNEAYRSILLSRFKDQGIVTRYSFRDLLPDNPSKERATEFFNALDIFPDGALSWSELYSFDINKILMEFPDMFGIGIHERQNEETNEDFLVDDFKSDDDDFELEFLDKAYEYELSLKADDQDVEDNTEDSLPLPDSVSGNTPSLPDESIISEREASADSESHDINAQESYTTNLNEDEISAAFDSFVEQKFESINHTSKVQRDEL